MTWVKWILTYVFDCAHRRTSWPQRGRAGDYVCCLECGREFPYSTRLMSIVSKEEQPGDRSGYGWDGFGNGGSAPLARSAKASVSTMLQ